MKLVAFDPETAFKPRVVAFLKWTTVNGRDDWAWTKVEPPFEPVDNGPNEQLDMVLLGARHVGETVGSFTSPIHVYVCTVKSNDAALPSSVNPDDIIILYWGLLVDQET